MVDRKEYDDVKVAFESKFDEIKQLPSTLNDAVDRLKWIQVPIYLYVTEKRDDAQEHLKALIQKLEEAAEGILAPYLFIDYAADWQQISSHVSQASGAIGSPTVSLEGHWEGKAYSRFKDSREHQVAALTTASDMGQKIHTELLNLAQEGRNFYKAIVDKLATLIAQVGTALTEIGTVVGAPWGIEKFSDAIVTTVELLVESMTSFVEVQSKVAISSNELTNIIAHPAAFPSEGDGKDHWPASVAPGFSDKSDWKLAE
jgi:uncharacterized protein YukE